ncbi:MAG: hypothetical protein ACR2LR_15355, partial [Hassallia sp.]
HVWLKRESLLRDSRSHAPIEVRNKCLDLSSFYIAEGIVVKEDAIDLLDSEDAIDLMNSEEDAMNRVSTRGGRQRGGVTGVFNPMLSKNSLSKIVRWYKGRCTFEINEIYQGFGWQERFYDEIIRNEFALDRIRQYIINNSINWERDREQPSH